MTIAPQHRKTLFHVGFWGLCVVTLFWLGFAVLSGAGPGGWPDFWRNSPNALPWLGAALLLGAGYRFPRPVGLAFIALAAITAIVFESYANAFLFALLTLPFLVFGAALAASGPREGRQPPNLS